MARTSSSGEYQVLARRHRPRTFDDVVGQDHVARTLKKAIESGRLAHAFLFAGTRGTGKTSMARILAKALNCLSAPGPTASPCLRCDSCEAIARGDDIDVVEIDAASNTQVDKTRQVVLEDAQYRPARGRFKIYIIDEVHMLSKASFNALLKTLEEPPGHVKFILATTEPEKVLPTILSRCQRYDFRNIGPREIAASLKSVCEQERARVDESALQLIARFAAGSMRDGLSLLERLLSAGEERLTAETVETLLGLPRAQAVFELAGAIGEGRAKDVLTGVDNLISGGVSADTLLGSLAEHLRDLLIIRTCGADSAILGPTNLPIEGLAAQAERFDPAMLCQDIAIVEELRRQLRQTQAGRALLDATMVRLAMAEQFASAADLLARIEAGAGAGAVEKKKPVEPVRKAAVMPAARPPAAPAGGARVHPATPPSAGAGAGAPRGDAGGGGEPCNIRPVSPDDLPGLWRALLEAMQQRGGAMYALLERGSLVNIEDEQAVIRYQSEDQHLPKLLSRNGKRELVCDALSRLLGRAIGVRFEVDGQPAPGTASAAAGAAAPAPPAAPHIAPGPIEQSPETDQRAFPQPAALPAGISPEEKRQFESDPLIRALMADLGATIVKISEDQAHV